ncbi:hypothetical protein UL82_05475 [Corynebacterium kutscheri]|uniref:Carotene biosynthesis associated membrane protein n=1 Tax=Corynebacterium kutscheri TaxID=35755 RepID=A0A0F6R0F0_9CORY|nr:polyprenol phosphomannose-dependent alpha 1,6 mannosyltransferase MptB [Corynebacterium kutscheri]AKE41270.1 hypothetical protein UL82_05475 [Corynebacterium kutscheri]VEH09592.1 alpha(1-->6) mannopyranosyltransferase [Corynebacterium kutscheri]
MHELYQAVRGELPRMGKPGSRSALLHFEQLPSNAKLSVIEAYRVTRLRWIGATGVILIAIGGLGAGALPVVNSTYIGYPLGSLLSRMLQTSTILCFIGIGLLVVAWLKLAAYVGVYLRGKNQHQGIVTNSFIWRTYLAWSLPFLLTAPMFSQDIYSYLANGSIVRQGLDPYSAGPIDILGADDPLARSVPFIWAHSPSPYGPVSLGLARIISAMTGDNIALGVFAHRVVSIAGIALAAWALMTLAQRCRVQPQAALWLGILNPLTIIHLVAGIHNEAILLGLLLGGFELGLRGIDKLMLGWHTQSMLLLCAGSFLISCAGMVKVTGFIGLGFIGVFHARVLHGREHKHFYSWAVAILSQVFILIGSVILVTLISGINTGWISAQGGAVSIRSWMSAATGVGVVFGWLGMVLDLGDHTEAILSVTRAVGIAVAGIFMLRMLIGTYRGVIHPLGALGISTFVLVILFPVVHPWYMLWAIFPLAGWANRILFRGMVMGYSAIISFFVLPRGLSLPPTTVLSIYIGAAIGFSILASIYWWVTRRVR